jgi:hypothetical protein
VPDGRLIDTRDNGSIQSGEAFFGENGDSKPGRGDASTGAAGGRTEVRLDRLEEDQRVAREAPGGGYDQNPIVAGDGKLKRFACLIVDGSVA